MSMTDIPIEGGLGTLIQPGDTVITDMYSDTVDFNIAATYGDLPRTREVSGQIEGVLLVASAVLGFTPDEEGWIHFFDADPNTASGDAWLALAEHQAKIGSVRFFPADWDATPTNGSAYKEVEVPFHAVDTLYAVFRNLGADINDLPKDTEQLEINIWYRRDD